MTRKRMRKADIARTEPDSGVFSVSEIKQMHRLKIKRVPTYVYLALKLETQESDWIHTVRFCRDYKLWKSKYIESLRVLEDRGFIEYEQSGDRKSYRIIFSHGGSH